jgi:hypothetical protein
MKGSKGNTDKQGKKMRPVNTIQFDKDEDGDLMQLINNYALVFNERVMKKTSPRNAIRNLLARVLPVEIKELRDGDRLAS